TIVSAKLYLYCSNGDATAIPIDVHRVTSNWTETGATWQYRNMAASLLWSTLGGDFDPAITATTPVSVGSTWYEWNVQSLVQGWVTGTPNNGMYVRSTSTTSKEYIFSSKESTTNKPRLEIQYVAGSTNPTRTDLQASPLLVSG